MLFGFNCSLTVVRHLMSFWIELRDVISLDTALLSKIERIKYLNCLNSCSLLGGKLPLGGFEKWLLDRKCRLRSSVVAVGPNSISHLVTLICANADLNIFVKDDVHLPSFHAFLKTVATVTLTISDASWWQREIFSCICEQREKIVSVHATNVSTYCLDKLCSIVTCRSVKIQSDTAIVEYNNGTLSTTGAVSYVPTYSWIEQFSPVVQFFGSIAVTEGSKLLTNNASFLTSIIAYSVCGKALVPCHNLTCLDVNNFRAADAADALAWKEVAKRMHLFTLFRLSGEFEYQQLLAGASLVTHTGSAADHNLLMEMLEGAQIKLTALEIGLPLGQGLARCPGSVLQCVERVKVDGWNTSAEVGHIAANAPRATELSATDVNWEEWQVLMALPRRWRSIDISALREADVETLETHCALLCTQRESLQRYYIAHCFLLKLERFLSGNAVIQSVRLGVEELKYGDVLSKVRTCDDVPFKSVSALLKVIDFPRLCEVHLRYMPFGAAEAMILLSALSADRLEAFSLGEVTTPSYLDEERSAAHPGASWVAAWWHGWKFVDKNDWIPRMLGRFPNLRRFQSRFVSFDRDSQVFTVSMSSVFNNAKINAFAEVMKQMQVHVAGRCELPLGLLCLDAMMKIAPIVAASESSYEIRKSINITALAFQKFLWSFDLFGFHGRFNWDKLQVHFFFQYGPVKID